MTLDNINFLYAIASKALAERRIRLMISGVGVNATFGFDVRWVSVERTEAVSSSIRLFSALLSALSPLLSHMPSLLS